MVGGGGHASDVLGVVEAGADQTIEIIGIVDDGDIDTARFCGRGVRQIGTVGEADTTGATHFVLGLGWPAVRSDVAAKLDGSDLLPVSLRHPSASVAIHSSLGEGTVLFGHCSVAPMVEVGRHAHIGHLAIVGHDSRLGDFASVMPGAVVSGGCEVGPRTTIGTNATVIEGVSIGPDILVGAGAVVVDDLTTPGTYVGQPARPIGERAGR